MQGTIGPDVARAAVALRRSHPHVPAREVLDVVLRQRAGSLANFGDPLEPGGAFAPNRPKTCNIFQAQIGELMRFAIQKGWRDPGTNPVTGIIPTKSAPVRDGYPTDSEVRRIKVAGIYATVRADAKPGAKRQKNRSGLMLAALVDMAYLTGQRISDLLSLEWSAFGRDGIAFKPSKTSKSTGASVLVQWTPNYATLNVGCVSCARNGGCLRQRCSRGRRARPTCTGAPPAPGAELASVPASTTAGSMTCGRRR